MWRPIGWIGPVLESDVQGNSHFHNACPACSTTTFYLCHAHPSHTAAAPRLATSPRQHLFFLAPPALLAPSAPPVPTHPTSTLPLRSPHTPIPPMSLPPEVARP
ncbi:hypothetical protein B0H14DRAFT_3521851 [Mycena olivaceomarginata]|nr:hypothetical protein B0H14DRAFT_3521851 [Mycena olivaceomarginata]